MKDFRIGIGYDVHRMAPERDLMLCTCHIPNETGLDGHSDADAPVHALIDAMFGALALGDIGQHYPDDDPQYLGASGETLLRKTLALPEFQGWRIGNADITIIAQKPKLAPYVPQMREALAKILGVGADHVSIKAKTAKGLDSVGHCQAIEAHAAVLLFPRDGA